MNDRLIAFLRIGLAALLLTLLWQGRPQRLDVRLGQPQTVYQATAGAFPITITLIPHGNDNGPVTLTIHSGARLVGTIESHYNYDFFANQSAGWLRHTWVDGDWQRDLQIVIANRLGYAYISSQDGQLYWSTREE